MAGNPNQMPQQPQQPNELMPGVQFSQAPTYQAPDANLPQILGTISGLGLNLLGAATGRGAAGNAVLNDVQQMQNRAEDGAMREFQLKRQAREIAGDEEIARTLVPQIERLPADRRAEATALLQNRDWARVQAMIRQQTVDDKQQKDEFNRLKTEANARILGLKKETPESFAPTAQAIEKFFRQVPATALKDDPKSITNLAENLRTYIQNGTGKKIDKAMAEGYVQRGLEHNAKINAGFGRPSLMPDQTFSGFSANLIAENVDTEERVAQNRKQMQAIEKARQKASFAKGAQKEKAYDELQAAVMGELPANTPAPRPAAAAAPSSNAQIRLPSGEVMNIPRSKLDTAIKKFKAVEVK
jgi:hypothetical protein